MAFGTSIPMYKRVPVCQVPEQIMSGNHKSIGHKYPFKTIINILILIFVGWPVAGFAAWIYIFISPFAACLGSGELSKLSMKSLPYS